MPAIVLLFFIAAEAFLKSHLKNPLHPVCLGIFVLCVAYFLYYFRRNPQGVAVWENFLSQKPSYRWNSWIVAGIILLGCFLRFWKLGTLFDGMTYDEAYKGLDAIGIRELGERPIFLDWNGGREALVAYLVAAAQSLFDYSSVSVRIVTAIAGSLSLLFFYLFVKTIFNNQLALISTFLLAVSKWHIIHSRYGVRAGLYPFFELASLYFVARGLSSDRKRTGFLIAAGVIGGLGLYTYIAYRIFPFVLLAFLAERTIRANLSRHLKPILAGIIVCLAVAAPFAKFSMENKESLTDRMKRTMVWRQKGNEEQSPAKLILESTAKTLGLFTYKGDSIARHNVKEEPMLSPFVTAFFLLGVLMVLLNLGKPYGRFLLLYFLFTLLPGVLSVGAPNVPRVFGSLPVAILFTSFGIYSAGQILNGYAPVIARLFLPLVLSGALLTGILDAMVRYPVILDTLPSKVAALWGMDRDQANVARLTNQLGNRCEVYITPKFFFHSTNEYLTYSKSFYKLITPATNLRKIASKDKLIVVLLQPQEVNPWWLRDDEGKKFYKWWHQIYGMDMRTIRMNIRKSYNAPFTRASDEKLLNALKMQYPKGKELRFEYFGAYVFSTVDSR